VNHRELLDIYEARGGEDVYEQAKRLYEAALAKRPTTPSCSATTATCSSATPAARSMSPSACTNARSSSTPRPRRPDSNNISGDYSSAFLLEREGRLAEAADQWRAILDWSLARGNELDAEWPRRELDRLEQRLEA
jgi:hypothetical protein